MIEFLHRLFIGHNHKWAIINESKVYESSPSELPLGTRYTMKCEHCGKIKVFNGW